MRKRNIIIIFIVLIVAVVGARFWFKAKAPVPTTPAPAAAKPSVPTALEFLASEIVTTEPAELRRMMQGLIAGLEKQNATYPVDKETKSPVKPVLP